MSKPLKSKSNSDTSTTSATSSPTSSGTSASTHQTTIHACAACRFQRRKCAPNCLLAPYFPAHKHQQFINAYKLFGVNNIAKTLTSVDSSLRDDAMTALVYTANARANDPVGGCTRIIQSLADQIAFLEAELDAVLEQIDAVKGFEDDEYEGSESGGKGLVHGPCSLFMPAVHLSPELSDYDEDIKPLQDIKLRAKLSDQMYDIEDIKLAICHSDSDSDTDTMEPSRTNS